MLMFHCITSSSIFYKKLDVSSTLYFDRSISIDVLLVFDTELFNLLKSMDTSEYLNNKESFLQENNGKILLYLLDLVPGKVYNTFELPYNGEYMVVGYVIIMDNRSSAKMQKQHFVTKILTGTKADNHIKVLCNNNGLMFIN